MANKTIDLVLCIVMMGWAVHWLQDRSPILALISIGCAVASLGVFIYRED